MLHIACGRAGGQGDDCPRDSRQWGRFVLGGRQEGRLAYFMSWLSSGLVN